jgi:hypothetical protein
MRDGKVRLWSTQTAAAWDAAVRRDVLRADGRRAMREFRDAYLWMMGQMAERLPGYGGGWPVWAWACPRPDLRCKGFLSSGSPGVLVEAVVPVERVLLSDFDTWHCVLNRHYLALSEEEDDAHDAGREDGPSPEKSWERIFDFAALDGSAYAGPVRVVQATVEEIRLSEIVSIRSFVAR